ncbi:uncharacterized protein SPSK_01338 [Sporothrix schenckii 1099-18]|uniref:Uncharacterized protein n=1 Tax=Sporothrix schenckii 1099-18 TaxID=1397361 RepID=A0A0F2LY42_SPOSC|nr:uncharacterized protein SPSK_01338 [Sporothrix schenckii 1099-18]KJR81405.1 hypothetical protein SPSK_01338 [Sporothrix schenckii 1099-18]
MVGSSSGLGGILEFKGLEASAERPPVVFGAQGRASELQQWDKKPEIPIKAMHPTRRANRGQPMRARRGLKNRKCQ